MTKGSHGVFIIFLILSPGCCNAAKNKTSPAAAAPSSSSCCNAEWAEGVKQLKLVAGDGAASDHFGFSVAISSNGGRVVVGDNRASSDTGAAYVFDGATGEQLRKLVASDRAEGDDFGFSVAVSWNGARVVAGATGNDDLGHESGTAYVFNGATGEQLLKLAARGDHDEADAHFGYSVAISSDARFGAWVVVGAPLTDYKGFGSGATYVFDGATGEQVLRLVASDSAFGNSFGFSVAISSDGARIVTGAPLDDDKGANSGSVYVFNRASGEQLQKLVAGDGAVSDDFGRSVAVSSDGGRVAVASTRFAYVFDVATGQQLLKLAEGGQAIAVSSDAALVAVHGTGSVYMFDGATGEQLLELAAGPWSQVAISSDGARFLTSAGDNEARLHDTAKLLGGDSDWMKWLPKIGALVVALALLGGVVSSGTRDARRPGSAWTPPRVTAWDFMIC